MAPVLKLAEFLHDILFLLWMVHTPIWGTANAFTFTPITDLAIK